MAEPLKEMFNKAYFERLAGAVKKVHAAFDRERFLKDVLDGLEARELNARMRHTSMMLQRYLPESYPDTVTILREVATAMPKGYTALLYPDFIGQFGLHAPSYSLEALRYFTTYGSSEFAVREFLRKEPTRTLAVMRRWAEDENEHVRRLASEGSRPRLPWSFRLDAVVKDPNLTFPILDRLRTEPSRYVQKSVANHLNDIAKDHPEWMLDVLERWDLKHPATAWIAKHACRNLIKQGHGRALKLFAFEAATAIAIEDLKVSPRRLKLGDVLEITFHIRSKATRAQKLVIDYRIHYARAGEKTSMKVFKLKECLLEGGESNVLKKRQRIQDFSTRKHHAGKHMVEVLVNGNVLGRSEFILTI